LRNRGFHEVRVAQTRWNAASLMGGRLTDESAMVIFLEAIRIALNRLGIEHVT